MKVITKHTDYALRALLCLAGRDGFVSARAIAGKSKTPLRLTRRLLQEMVSGGILESREGTQGGVRLARSPEKISLLDILALFQKRLELSECRFRGKPCPNRARCIVRPHLQRIEKQLAGEFKKITLSFLLSS